ncbi:MAG: hypothetical protein II453_08910 [Alphaproteobacteria bacterium]|nr:hypothetical protein [Alphaproteobacteria bacterium]
MSNYTVSALTDYIKTNESVILRDTVLGSGIKGETIPMMRKQLGVKTSERLNYLDVTPVLQAVTGCGFSAQGSTVFSERDITTAQAKYNDEWCIEKLLGKFTEYEVRIGADDQAMPFEAEIVDQVVKGINKAVEMQVWQGNTASGSLINGLVTIALGADSASTITGETASGATAYAAIKQAYMALPEEIVDEAVIFVSPAIFREYVQDLVTANLYHYDPAFSGELTEMFIPGTDVKVRKTYGLTGSNYIYATVPENMVYATDFVNNKEEIKGWYSDDDDVYRMKSRFNFGVNTLFPDAVVLVEKK